LAGKRKEGKRGKEVKGREGEAKKAREGAQMVRLAGEGQNLKLCH